MSLLNFLVLNSRTLWIFTNLTFLIVLAISNYFFFHHSKENLTQNFHQNVENRLSFSFNLVPGESLFLIRTKTVPSFIQILPNPYEDGRNTEHLAKVGTLHPKFTVLLKKLLLMNTFNEENQKLEEMDIPIEKVKKNTKLIVDCGCNIGYFSLFAAALGHSAIAIEANPFLSSIIQRSIAINHWNDKIKFYSRIISDEPSGTLQTFQIYPNHWGLSYVSDLKDIENEIHDESLKVLVQTIRIDDVVQEDVYILKIDVEGSELKALLSAQKLLTHYKVENIFVEWDKVKHQMEAVQMLHWLNEILSYEIYCLPYESYDEEIEDWKEVTWEKEAQLIEPHLFDQIPCSDLWIKKKKRKET